MPNGAMPEQDEHYYVAGYSVEDDPYVLPNGVLINSLNLTTTAELGEAEAEFVPYRTAELWDSPVAGRFDVAHLQEIHRRLFQDIYPWAGQCRKVDIAKGDTMFLANGLILKRADELFAGLAAEKHLQGMDAPAFCERSAEYLGKLNFIHPFREGNGRTQREFIGQLAREAGFLIDWSGYAPSSMRDACIAAQETNYRPLMRILLAGIKAFPVNQ